MTTELYAVIGPTGTGKTDLAMDLCELIDSEIVSVDSAQVFRGLDVGTAKPTQKEQRRVKHHVIDTIEPDEQWSAVDYMEAADRAIETLTSANRIPVLCGGTGLWLRALIHGICQAPAIDDAVRAEVRRDLEEKGAVAMHAELARVDPVAAARIKPQDPQRIGRALEVFRQEGVPLSQLQRAHGFKEKRYALRCVAYRWPKAELNERLALRARKMYQTGLLEETRACLDSGISRDAPGLSIIGYRDAVRCLEGELTEDQAVEATSIATRQYAKRQRNWFQKEPEALIWIDPAKPPLEVLELLRAASSQR